MKRVSTTYEKGCCAGEISPYDEEETNAYRATLRSEWPAEYDGETLERKTRLPQKATEKRVVQSGFEWNHNTKAEREATYAPLQTNGVRRKGMLCYGLFPRTELLQSVIVTQKPAVLCDTLVTHSTQGSWSIPCTTCLSSMLTLTTARRAC